MTQPQPSRRAVVAGLGAGALAVADPARAAAREVTLALATATLAVDTATYSSLPLSLGFYEQDGLRATILPLAGSGAVAQVLIGGTAEIGTPGTSAGLYVPASRGANLVSIYHFVTHSFQLPAVPADSPIRRVADFKGKRIGVAALGSGTVPIIKSMLKEAGLDPERDVDFVQVGTGAQAAASLFVTRAVDILGHWDGAYALMENIAPDKYKLRTITSPRTTALAFQVAVVMRRDALAKDREIGVGIGRAIAKSSVFALENPAAAVAIHYKTYPEQKPRNVGDDEAIRQGVRLLTARLENMRIDDKTNWSRRAWGWHDDAEVRDYYELLRESGELRDEIKDVSRLYTNDLVDDINRFDEAAIRKLASEWRP